MAVVLKLLQSGTAQMSDVQTSITQTITSVDTTKAVLIAQYATQDGQPDQALVSHELTNATTITFQRVAVDELVDITWYVVEFSSGVTVQRGSQDMGALTRNVTITAVDLAKSFAIIYDRTTGGNFSGDDFVGAEITTTTNLQLTINGTRVGHIVQWQVVEYDDCAVQTGNLTFLTGDSSKTDTLTSVDTNKSWLIFSYKSDSGTAADIGQKLVRGVITNATTLTFDRDNTGQEIDLTWFLVEFTDGTTVQKGSESFGTSDTVKNVTVTSVDLNGTAAAIAGLYNTGGKSPFNTTDKPGVSQFTAELTTATNLKLTRNFTGTATADVAWFLIEFPVVAAIMAVDRHYPRGIHRGITRGVS